MHSVPLCPGGVRDYRSMNDVRNFRYELEIEKERAKILERRRRLREYNGLDNTNTADTEENTREEVYAQTTKRPRGRPRIRPDEGKGSKPTENEKKTEERVEENTSSALDDVDADFGSSQPLRVVLNENSSNHIKIRFVRSASMDGDQGQTVRLPRRRGRPPKTGGKRKAKSLNTEPYEHSEPPELEMMPPPYDEKENVSDYEDFVQVSIKEWCPFDLSGILDIGRL